MTLLFTYLKKLKKIDTSFTRYQFGDSFSRPRIRLFTISAGSCGLLGSCCFKSQSIILLFGCLADDSSFWFV